MNDEYATAYVAVQFMVDRKAPLETILDTLGDTPEALVTEVYDTIKSEQFEHDRAWATT